MEEDEFMARGTIPKITWGTSYANTLNFGYPLDSATSYSEHREGSVWDMFVSGVEDAWLWGIDYFLEGDFRWIPASSTSDPVATGWDGSTGVRAFLEWARQKNSFRFFPDKNSGTYLDCYLMEPMQGPPSLEDDGSRRLHLKIRSATAFDGY